MKMSILISLSIFASLLPALVAPQSLVVVGGALADGNAPIWDKVVELAVNITNHFKSCIKSNHFCSTVQGGKGVAKIGIFATASADPQVRQNALKTQSVDLKFCLP